MSFSLKCLSQQNALLEFVKPFYGIRILWCPIKMRVFHQNESCLACPHPPSSYGGRREQGDSSHFDEKRENVGRPLEIDIEAPGPGGWK